MWNNQREGGRERERGRLIIHDNINKQCSNSCGKSKTLTLWEIQCK